MDKIEEIRIKRKAAHSKLLSLKLKVYERFLQMEEAAYSDGALTKKQKELIAIGISVVIDCESCMECILLKLPLQVLPSERFLKPLKWESSLEVDPPRFQRDSR